MTDPTSPSGGDQNWWHNDPSGDPPAAQDQIALNSATIPAQHLCVYGNASSTTCADAREGQRHPRPVLQQVARRRSELAMRVVRPPYSAGPAFDVLGCRTIGLRG